MTAFLGELGRVWAAGRFAGAQRDIAPEGVRTPGIRGVIPVELPGGSRLPDSAPLLGSGRRRCGRYPSSGCGGAIRDAGRSMESVPLGRAAPPAARLPLYSFMSTFVVGLSTRRVDAFVYVGRAFN